LIRAHHPPLCAHGQRTAEAFRDGVIAVIIAIMLLELEVPHRTDWATLLPLLPVLLYYVLSFLYVGIYWNNPSDRTARAASRSRSMSSDWCSHFGSHGQAR
jgi:uncharacterized membrane protein